MRRNCELKRGVNSSLPWTKQSSYAWSTIIQQNTEDRPYLKKLPEMFSCSHRTTVTLFPCSRTLAMTAAKRPRRWPRPSITMAWNTGSTRLFTETQLPPNLKLWINTCKYSMFMMYSALGVLNIACFVADDEHTLTNWKEISVPNKKHARVTKYTLCPIYHVQERYLANPI